METQIAQTDIGEENVVEAKVQPSTEVQVEIQQSTKVQVMAEAQERVMEMERCDSKVIVKRRHTILDKVTLLEKSIKIPNLDQFMWIQTKHNYDKHVERMQNWKDIVEEEDQASKVGLVPLFLMD